MQLQDTPDTVEEILAAGAAGARRLASETMREVRDRMGFVPAAADRRSATGSGQRG
jgi:hypothetical protein